MDINEKAKKSGLRKGLKIAGLIASGTAIGVGFEKMVKRNKPASKIIKNGEFEILDEKTLMYFTHGLTVKDLGNLGKKFINAPGTFIDLDTPIDMEMTFRKKK